MLPFSSQVLSCCPATEKPETACAQSSSAKAAVRTLRVMERLSLTTMATLIHLVQKEKFA